MSDIYSLSIYLQIKSPCKKRFPSPLTLVRQRALQSWVLSLHYSRSSRPRICWKWAKCLHRNCLKSAHTNPRPSYNIQITTRSS